MALMRAMSTSARHRGSKLLRHALVCAAALLLAACSTTRPWINQPIMADAPSAPTQNIMSAAYEPGQRSTPSIVAAVTLSGGGARAAAFGLGVLQELKDTRFTWDGRNTTLLDEVGLISGVSGGSVLAGYYAAFGDEVFTRFERDFLLANFQSSLMWSLASPGNLYGLSSPWWGRSNVLTQRLDTVFRGTTFGDLRRNRPKPRLLVTATDLTTGAPFEFTPEQFALICSDLDSVPLSFAVAASSAVPILLSPITVRNYAGTCAQSAWLEEQAGADVNLAARLLHLIKQSYLDSDERPYIHLVDGGLVDNLGLRSLVDRIIAGGSLDASFRALPPGSVHKIVLISVNSERDTGDRIDTSDRVPGVGQVVSSLVFGAGSRLTKETTEMANDVVRRMSDELRADRMRPGSPFAADAEIYVINVSLHALRDPAVRRTLMRVPTAFTILPIQVRRLEIAGRQALRESPDFQRLRQSVAAQPEMAIADMPATP
jgi:NTE family protein